MLQSEFELDWNNATAEITSFIRSTVKASSANGCVIGLSGGVDSSLVAKLLVMALGADKVLGLLMPSQFTPKADLADAQSLAGQLEIKSEIIQIQPIADSFMKALEAKQGSEKYKIPLANVQARARMIVLYYHANLNNYLVAGTGDRSEDLIGYFTKYGDGGVDFLPISHLYKTQVRRLAEHLRLPASITSKPSSPQLYYGHQATDEIPIDYDRLDRVLRLLFDKGMTASDAARAALVDPRIVEDVLKRFHASAHKRSYPLMLRPW